MEKLDVKTDFVEMNIEKDSITIKALKKENYTLDDLRQKLINNLYNVTYYDKNDIEILKILFENKDI